MSEHGYKNYVTLKNKFKEENLFWISKVLIKWFELDQIDMTVQIDIH